MTLENQIALVTGASRGIGKAIALELGHRGATVIGTATTTTGAANISDFLQKNQITGSGKTLNVTEVDSIEQTLKQIEQEYGTISILVNNAGITRDNLLLRMQESEWEDIIQTNLTAIFRLSKRCLKGMAKQRYGRIISIASVVGVAGNAGQTNYAAAKAGIIGFSKSLAREMGSRNITVNVVAPGYITTDMTNNLSDTQQAALLQQIPLQRLGQTEDIAKAVAFLASSDADYITGETIHVNGGMYMN